MLPLLFLLFLGACLASGDPGGGGAEVEPPRPNGPGPSTDEPKPDAAMCVGTGETGQPCEVTGDCDNPLVCINKVCVGPDDPTHTCDNLDGVTCDDPSETCAPTGVCVVVPGECTTTDQCPTGFVCHDKACVPERDGMACLDPGPGPALTGTWDMKSTLHLRDGLPGLVSGLLSATEVIADLVEGTVDWGLPDWLETIINAVVPAIIDQYVPAWAQQIPIALSNVSDVLDDLQVDSTVYLSGGTCQASYRGYEKWEKITIEYRGRIISAAPQDIPEVGEIRPEEFGAMYSCGELYFDRHRIKNRIGGLIRWVVNSVIEASTGYRTVEDALSHAIDCQALADAIERATGSSGIADPVRNACTTAVGNIIAQIDAVLDEATITLSVLSLQGRARVTGERTLVDGIWNGSVVGFDFPGDFAAQR